MILCWVVSIPEARWSASRLKAELQLIQGGPVSSAAVCICTPFPCCPCRVAVRRIQNILLMASSTLSGVYSPPGPPQQIIHLPPTHPFLSSIPANGYCMFLTLWHLHIVGTFIGSNSILCPGSPRAVNIKLNGSGSGSNIRPLGFKFPNYLSDLGEIAFVPQFPHLENREPFYQLHRLLVD